MGTKNTLMTKLVKHVPHKAMKAMKAIPFADVANVAIEMTTTMKDYLLLCEVEHTKRDKIRAQRDIVIEEIRSKKEIILDYLDKSYKERSVILRKQFEVIDKALESENLDMLQVGLGAVIKVVETSPLVDFKQFSQDYNDASKVIDI